MFENILSSIEMTFYKEYFEDIKENRVFLFSKKAANSIWENKVDASASSYFKLPSDSWINMDEALFLGGWIDAYNNDTNFIVEKILRSSLDWKENSFILFLVNKNIVLKVKWKDFLKLWDSFLAIESDCPIVMLENSYQQEALLFTSRGEIYKFSVHNLK